MMVNPPEKTDMDPIKTLPLGELKARWGGEEAANTVTLLGAEDTRWRGLGSGGTQRVSTRQESGEGREGFLEEEANMQSPGTSGIYLRLPLAAQ